LVEHELKLAIRRKFINLDKANDLFDANHGGALATFAAKINVGYALDLFGTVTRDDLLIIKQLGIYLRTRL